jgi:hypothetical protein
MSGVGFAGLPESIEIDAAACSSGKSPCADPLKRNRRRGLPFEIVQ